MRYNELEQKLKENTKFDQCSVTAHISDDGIVTLEGMADTWRHVVDIGHFAAKQPGVVNVVNNMGAEDVTVKKRDNRKKIEKAKGFGVIEQAQITIIGGGVIGCAIARELSKYSAKIIVVEKNADVSEETSKANNGYIHPGHKAKPGTLKAKLNVRGNMMYDKWKEELGFEMLRYGQISVAYSEEDMQSIKKTYEDGIKNGVPKLQLLSKEEVLEQEPALGDKVAGGLFAATMGMVEPYQVCVALAENAVINGVKFMLSTEVLDVRVEEGTVKSVLTEKGIIETEYVINCAGIYADDIAEMAGDKFFTLHGRRGGIAIFDKNCKAPFTHALSTLPKNKDEESKGGGFSFTPEYNILVGPSAVEIPEKEDKSVEEEDLEYAFSRGRSVFPGLSKKDIIAMYAGIRAADYKEDFIVEMSKKVHGFINAAGIQSPGLASAPAIAEMVEGIVKDSMEKRGRVLKRKLNYQPYRKKQIAFRNLSREEQDELIQKNPAYGQVICRCEQITEGEILEVIHSPLVPTTVDAIKRRTRAGMGRCQGGFCQPRVVEILARELGCDWTSIYLKGRDGYILDKKSR